LVYSVITKYSHSYIKDPHLDIHIKMGQVVAEARCGGFSYMWGITNSAIAKVKTHTEETNI